MNAIGSWVLFDKSMLFAKSRILSQNNSENRMGK